jgi:polysaccharide pyruvyl transferase WcaK-like protein
MVKPVKKIGLLGPYGYGNLGDAAIQQAMIEHIHRYHPDAKVYGFSLNPRDTEQRHGIPSYSISREFETPGWVKRTVPKKVRDNSAVRWLVRIAVKLPAEFVLTAKAMRALKGFDLLIVSGGGQLDDYWGGPWWHPYTLLKFALIARLRKTEYVFVSVGAGPLDAALSRFFVRKALSLAGYRSYRDEGSKRFTQRIGFASDHDPVYPDLAYSLQPAENRAVHLPTRERRVVGIGPMTYFDPRIWPERDRSVYLNYLKKLAAFVAWLVEQGYAILFITGDAIHDRWAIDDLKVQLNGEDDIDASQILEPRIDTVEDLLGALATVDVVVASRLHSVILSHMLRKPVLAISYHEKIDTVMADLGQSEYCLSIDEFNVDALKKQFLVLVSNQPSLEAQIEEKTQAYCRALDEQYDHLFGNL